MKDYYERYWETGIKGKIMHEPPDNFREKHWAAFYNKVRRYLKNECLDVGSGSGFITSELNKIVTTSGLEISDAALKKARKTYPNMKFVKGSATDIPFNDNKFNCIFVSDVIEHVMDTEAMFHEFNRVLKKGGHLIITTPELTWLKRVFIALFYFNDYFYPINPHIRFYTKSTLKEILKKFGFKMIHYEHDGSFFWLVPKGMLVVAKKMR
jgi:ubiquinone/menaquinone biosynthesis C-methylase UbiE